MLERDIFKYWNVRVEAKRLSFMSSNQIYQKPITYWLMNLRNILEICIELYRTRWILSAHVNRLILTTNLLSLAMVVHQDFPMDQLGQVILVADLHHCRRAAFKRLFLLVHLPLLDYLGYSVACPVVCLNTHSIYCELYLQRLSNRNRNLYASPFLRTNFSCICSSWNSFDGRSKVCACVVLLLQER